LAEKSRQLAGKQFLLLFDLKVIRLREQVRRNIEKFPVHFMFQLINEEVEIMVSQNAIPSKQHFGGTNLMQNRHAPRNRMGFE
jgi:hypothetical protein